MTHSFTLSGLGDAPFEVIAPHQHSATFFCEHCGTTLLNQNFVKSNNGIVSVVGIDCLKKTGDLGLIAGAKRLAKEKAQAARMAKAESEHQSRQEAEREALGGKTRGEIVSEYEQAVEVQVSQLIYELKETFAYSVLEQSTFGTAMIHSAIFREPFSVRMIEVITDILAKHVSKSRKNSKAYKAALPLAQGHVDHFLAVPAKYAEVIAELTVESESVLAKAT